MRILAHIATLGISRQALMPPINDHKIMPQVVHAVENTVYKETATAFVIKNIMFGKLNPGAICDKALDWNDQIKTELLLAMRAYETSLSDTDRTVVELRCQDFTDRWTPKSEYAVLSPIYSSAPDGSPYAKTEVHTRITRDPVLDVMKHADEWVYFETEVD